jgi:cytochrome c553
MNSLRTGLSSILRAGLPPFMRASLILSLCVGLFAAMAALPAAARQPADTLPQRLQACTACHAADATPRSEQAYFPRIAGKPAGYLFNQLVNFRDGRRQSPQMAYMVNHLPDSYLLEIATYFSELHLAPARLSPVAAKAGALERGRLLVQQGDASRKLPACVGCHGQQLAGVVPAIPGLIGLPHDYINAQFGAWKNGQRRAKAPDCMADIANRLSPDDVSAISAWLSAQPVSPDARPQAALAHPLPLRCGSVP